MKVSIYEENKNFLIAKEYNKEEIQQLKVILNKKIQNYKFHPLCKKGLWDGNISFIDKCNRFPIGLWNYVLNEMKSFGYSVNIEGSETFFYDLDEKHFIDWVNNFFKDSEKKPRDYQIDAAIKIIKNKRSISELATNSGKTLIIFIIFAYMKSLGIGKFLMVVPNTSLILQTIDNFEEYNNNKMKYTIKSFYSESQNRGTDADFVIGTYHSLNKLDKKFLKDFKIVCIDEAHYANSKSIKNIIQKCDNAEWRFGLSGTMKQDLINADSLTIQAYLGPLINTISSKFLIDNDYATKIEIRQIILDYLDNDLRKNLYELKKSNDPNLTGNKIFNFEKNIFRNNKKRLDYIIDFISKCSKNSLVLFQDIKGEYGKNIYRILKEKKPDFKIIYIDGNTPVNDRDKYKNMMEQEDNIIIVASALVFGTGISINNIHNIFCVEGYKSETIVRQIIGRGMRLMAGKKVVKIIDFVDDFSVKNSKNILLKHGEEREEVYKKQGFEFNKYRVKL